SRPASDSHVGWLSILSVTQGFPAGGQAERTAGSGFYGTIAHGGRPVRYDCRGQRHHIAGTARPDSTNRRFGNQRAAGAPAGHPGSAWPRVWSRADRTEAVIHGRSSRNRIQGTRRAERGGGGHPGSPNRLGPRPRRFAKWKNGPEHGAIASSHARRIAYRA